jgi:membrane protein implicated in regulation of membrane protease activity
MAWWGWIIGGAILLGAELSFVSAQFYLVFIGAAAILVGLVTALSSALPVWIEWALFALLAIVSMMLFRSRVYERLHHTLPKVSTGPAGGVITLEVPLAAGASCQAEYGGSFWTVRNDSATPIAAGGRARITAVHELTLLVRPES